MNTSTLRNTSTGNGEPHTAAARKAFDPTRLFIQRDRLPWFWFFVAGAVIVLAAIDRYHLVSQFKQRERVVIIDPSGTYYLSPLLQFQEAKDLHLCHGCHPSFKFPTKSEALPRFGRDSYESI